jgi:hypothetical protein
LKISRYRQIPTFGRSTIRRFSTNASEMKKLAARNFEDLLQVSTSTLFSFLAHVSQCAIPAFEGLLPEPYNTDLMTLLYRLAEWHALAKLRMHTDSTLNLMDSVTTKLGQQLRKFRDTTCNNFATVELPKEVAAQKRRQTKAQGKKHAGSSSSLSMGGPTAQCTVPPAVSPQTESLPLPSTSNTAQAPKQRTLNLFTYKFHALADYVDTIRLFGTTDSYSTQTVSLSIHKPSIYMLMMLLLSRENLSIGEPSDFMDGPTRITPFDR